MCRLIDPLSGQLLREHLQQNSATPPHSRARSSYTNTAEHATATAPRRNHRTTHWCVVPGYASKTQAKKRYSRILGVLNLTKKHGVASTDEVCALGLETRASHYRFRAPLTWNITQTAAESASGRSTDPPAHALSRSHRKLNPKLKNRRIHHEPLIELDRALRQPCLGGMAAVPKLVCVRYKPKRWPPLT